MTNDCPSPLCPFLHLCLAAHQPSKATMLHSQLGLSFHDPRTPDVFTFNLEQVAPLSRHLLVEKKHQKK